ncbi:MAG: ABC transporter substrate-binding protein [Bacteroidales bacterium]|nr:ABC transporter substrate-binding protein [Bacteroidales bacterium]
MKPIKRIVIIAAVLAIFIVAVAFIVGAMMNITASTKRHEASVSVTDDYGRTVAVPSHPTRVVSLSPAVTEIIYALGAEELLVGRTDFCVYPPEAEAIPSIGGISNLNIEKILSLNPDLVISGSMVGKKVTDQMDAMGTPVVCVIEKPRFEALYDNITAIGHLVGKEHEADSLNKVLSCELLALSEADAIATRQPLKTHSSQLTAPTCYYVVGFGAGGNFTAGGNTFINDIIRMAGGRNIAEGVEGWSYSLEALMKEDPDYIIVRREDSAAFCGMKPYNRLRAVREGHVIGIESGTLDLQVPRNIDAILYLRERMKK